MADWKNPGLTGKLKYMQGDDTSNNEAATTSVAGNRDGSMLERLEQIQQDLTDDSATNFIGVDDSNNVAATTNVAANEDGSILERLEQIQEAVNVGTGTSLGANKSLVDALGTNGITLVDDAASVVGILGVDDSNNAFASTNVTANADGSILERLENLHQVQTGAAASIATHPLLGIKVSRTTADIITGTTVDLFTISGGRVLVTMFLGEVTTIIGAGATNLKFQANPTTGTTTDLSANLDIDADEAGTLYTLHGTATQATVRGESGSIPIMAGASRGIAVAAGTIASVTDADRTGSIKIDLWYWPIDTGATVVTA